MNKLLISLFFISGLVLAQGGEGNNTGCNGQGNPNSPCIGGQGGQGGNGGNGGAGGIGGSATSTSGSTATSNSEATGIGIGGTGGTGVAVGNGYGGQGGHSNQSQSNTSTNTINGTNTSTNTNTSAANNSANNTGNSSSKNTVVIQGDAAQARDPVATALGPTIVTGSDQCLVALSVGVQAVGFGFAAGSAVADTNCEALKLARQLDSMGYRAQALKLLMADPRVKAAFE